MKLFAVAVFLSGAAWALPAADIVARTVIGPKGYTCEGVQYSESYITSSMQHAAPIKHQYDRWLADPQLSNTKRKKITSSYPKTFSNHEKIHFSNCPSGPWIEFPLMRDYTSFNPNFKPEEPALLQKPGEDNPARVIFQVATGFGTARFCGVITHSDTILRGRFKRCTKIPSSYIGVAVARLGSACARLSSALGSCVSRAKP
ncbi:hypothetical protein DXG01_016995 [Tephrocybe rancida]|nr:hypothetical protein DXG01_016995 [Tephrocybe rancida]